jgi:hypothetical protein
MLLSPFGNLSHTSILYYTDLGAIQYLNGMDRMAVSL